MSLDAAVARMSELQALLVSARAAGPSVGTVAPTESAAFANQLVQASTATAAPVATAAGTAPATSGAGTPYDDLIAQAAARNGVDPALLKGLIRQESNFDPNAGSPAGAQGLTQLMPGTAASLGVSDVTDPAQAIEGGAKYLRRQLDAFGGDVTKALAAYNAGPGAVQRYGGVPPFAETQQYVQRVQEFAAGYRTATAPPAPLLPQTTTTTVLPYSTV